MLAKAVVCMGGKVCGGMHWGVGDGGIIGGGERLLGLAYSFFKLL